MTSFLEWRRLFLGGRLGAGPPLEPPRDPPKVRTRAFGDPRGSSTRTPCARARTACAYWAPLDFLVGDRGVPKARWRALGRRLSHPWGFPVVTRGGQGATRGRPRMYMYMYTYALARARVRQAAQGCALRCARECGWWCVGGWGGGAGGLQRGACRHDGPRKVRPTLTKVRPSALLNFLCAPGRSKARLGAPPGRTGAHPGAPRSTQEHPGAPRSTQE